ncbi:glycosyltransferase [Leuconostoc palmae]|uniref:glycosyltransferase n=1 Tax=Leuconostoc palmae TaxID=501487 RepID=UPI001C7E0975|nr:glycosyltransferase [Leuconostoc palmae]
MTIEIIKSLVDAQLYDVAWQIARVKSGQSEELWVTTPHEDASFLAEKLGLPLNKVFDVYSQQYLCELKVHLGIFWTDLPVPNNAKFIMDKDGSKYVVSFGRVIAKIRCFNGSPRIVQSVTWLTSSGDIDYKSIYQRDGHLFAVQYFNDNKLFVTEYYFGYGDRKVTDFYNESQRDFVYAFNDKYESFEHYVADVLHRVTNNMFNLTRINNLLTLLPNNTIITFVDGITDEHGEIKPIIKQLLSQSKKYFVEIRVTTKDYDLLEMSGLNHKTHHITMI